jgi:hypothetical protein
MNTDAENIREALLVGDVKTDNMKIKTRKKLAKSIDAEI